MYVFSAYNVKWNSEIYIEHIGFVFFVKFCRRVILFKENIIYNNTKIVIKTTLYLLSYKLVKFCFDSSFESNASIYYYFQVYLNIFCDTVNYVVYRYKKQSNSLITERTNQIMASVTDSLSSDKHRGYVKASHSDM